MMEGEQYVVGNIKKIETVYPYPDAPREKTIPVIVREESYTGDGEMLTSLHETAVNMARVLVARGMYPVVHVWIKEFNKHLFPKIEFDVGFQELQFDMAENGSIKERHFKTFRGRQRKDIEKMWAEGMLQDIDSMF